MHDERLYAERALQLGAQGYITKEDATTNILFAIRQVLSRQVYLSDRMASRMMQMKANGGRSEPGSPLEILTERESEVFERIGRGMGTRHIAEELLLGVKAVESCRARISEKLQLNDGDQLLQCAIEWAQKGEGWAAGIAAKASYKAPAAITPEAGRIPCKERVQL
jgi:DNA-binding NarL/FixJ family response regulator